MFEYLWWEMRMIRHWRRSRFGRGCGSVSLNSPSSFSASIVAVSVCASKRGRIATTLELQLLHQLFRGGLLSARALARRRGTRPLSLACQVNRFQSFVFDSILTLQQRVFLFVCVGLPLERGHQAQRWLPQTPACVQHDAVTR